MGDGELRFRHVHLDFHTSPDIPGVGAEFDPEAFAETLQAAHVNTINCFARCHHGYVYYDSKAFPERRHPHLKRDLLREQIEACHARGIRVPIYITVKWDHFTAQEHPEWLVVDPTGRRPGSAPYEPGFYAEFCLNTPYVDFLRAQVTEVLETLPVDGLWFDIVFPQDCSCPRCRAGMKAEGLDPSDTEVRRAYGVRIVDDFRLAMTHFVRGLQPGCPVFYNAGHVGTGTRRAAAAYSHLELESLPSGNWGYLHFPLAMRYARTLGLEALGMTGKFHTAWGDFGSLKNLAALQFECFRMLALNAKCSVGDQLHPSGRLDASTYELIGAVFAEVERKEPWCRRAQPLVDIGVFSAEEFAREQMPAASLGVVRMLQEGGHQFDVIDSACDLSRYRVVILPDCITMSPELYLGAGGAVLASHRSGLNAEGTAFALDALGVTLKGPAPFSPDFLRAGAAVAAGVPATDLVMYLQGMEVEAGPGSEVLAEVAVPYFNRTHRHFCSHKHTPSSGKIGYPGLVRKGQAIYFAHPIFTQYQTNAPLWCKRLFLNALALLLPEPQVRVQAPSATMVALNSQEAERRWVLHLLHYVPERRGTDFDVIEDVVPITEVGVSIRCEQPPTRVALAPEGDALPFTMREGRVEFTVPKVTGHQMVALEFA